MSISFETAKKLKEAGLKHQLEQGDLCYRPNREVAPMWWSPEFIYGSLDAMLNDWQFAVDEEGIAWFAPRLEQMLAEIEKRGYEWEIYKERPNCKNGPYSACIEKFNYVDEYEYEHIFADSPEEATAQVLIWILEQEDRT